MSSVTGGVASLWEGDVSEPAKELWKRLRKYLCEEFGFESHELMVDIKYNRLLVHCCLCGFYFRVMSHAKGGGWENDTLVIVNMDFSSSHLQCRARLFQFLVDQADDLGFKRMAIECPNQGADEFGRGLGMLSYKAQGSLIAHVEVIRHYLLVQRRHEWLK